LISVLNDGERFALSSGSLNLRDSVTNKLSIVNGLVSALHNHSGHANNVYEAPNKMCCPAVERHKIGLSGQLHDQPVPRYLI
jgi:hypothetical protein